MFEQAFKNIDDILHKDAGCSSELDYVEQTSWILFLKYLDDLEKDKIKYAYLAGKTYDGIIEKQFKWDVWAFPKGKDGKLDHHKALAGDDLKEFVDHKLFPYLKKFKSNAESPDTIEYKIGEIFNELKNKIQSGYNLREVINLIDELRFHSHTEKHEMSHLYEDKIKNMGNAGRNGGEYYTPRPLIKTIVKVVAPEIGDKIYDGAVGSAGFLCEAFEYLKSKKNLTTKNVQTLQKNTFYGKEKKSLAYIIGTMNMILHGIEAPNIVHTNTLAENLADIQEKDRYDIVLANPPFGGKERAEVQQNFPVKTGETAFLFLQHFIKILKAGGRAGVVIKNTFLSSMDNASINLRKLLLETCNLHTVLDLPGGTFTGAGVKTVVLFFEKGLPTRKVWFYQLNLDRNLGKTNPLNENDLADFLKLQKTKADSDNSWALNVSELDPTTYDLSVKNPHKKNEIMLREPQTILNELKKLNNESAELLNKIGDFELALKSVFANSDAKWEIKRLGDICDIIGGGTPSKAISKFYNGDIPWATVRDMRYEIIEETEHKITKEAIKNSSTNIIHKGNVVIATRVGLGKVCLLKNDTAINQDLRGIVPKNPSILLVGYLFQWLKSIAHIIENEGTGATVQGVKLPFIKSLQIPIPPYSEQRSIVAKFNALSVEIEKLNTVYDKKINQLNELRRTVLQKSFNAGSTGARL